MAVKNWHVRVREQITRERLALKKIPQKLLRKGPIKENRRLVLGARREHLTDLALQMMRGRGEIINFLKTPPAGKADLIWGIDFYIVVLWGGRRRIVTLSVTGPQGLICHQLKHPELSHLAIRGSETIEKIRRKLRIIISDELKKGA
jgi:hypothetical protein